MNRKKALIYSVATLLWMALIFFFSSQPADKSSSVSGFVGDMVNNVLVIIFGGERGSYISSVILNEFIIRKTGHFFEYLVLGVLCSSSLLFWGLKRSYIIAVLISVLYSISDEVHQIFIAGRGPAAADVILDSIASVIGILLIFVISKRRSIHKKI